MLSREDRLRISLIKDNPKKKLQAKELVGFLCEICGERQATHVIKGSLVVCCASRADQCPALVPFPTASCWCCGLPAAKKTKVGWTCGRDQRYGCPNSKSIGVRRKADSFNKRMMDPILKAQREERYQATMLGRHGGTHTLNSSARANWEASMLEKYGAINPQHCEEIKQRHRVSMSRAMSKEENRFRLVKRIKLQFGVNSVVQSKDWRDSYRDKTGVDHPMKLESSKETQAKTWMENYPEGHPARNKSVRNKFLSTMVGRYGKDNPIKVPEIFKRRSETYLKHFGTPILMHSREVYKRWLSGMYRSHPLTLPSGRVVHYDGYERWVIEEQLSLRPETDLLFNGDLQIPYKTPDGVDHVYYPDLALVSDKTIIETKSPYTFEQALSSTLPSKILGCLEKGWSVRVEIRNHRGAVLHALSGIEILRGALS